MRYVYLIRNTVNNKVYVGQTKDFASRKAGHLYTARQGNIRPLYASIRKHGEDKFKFEILEECTDELINEREQYWVAHFDSFNPEKGYNLTSGGNQHCHVAPRSEETRQKLSKAFTGRRLTEQTRKKVSEAVKLRFATMSDEERREFAERTSKRSKGEKNPMFGRRGGRFTIEQREELFEQFRSTKLTDRELATRFNVSRFTIMRRRREFIDQSSSG